MHHRHHFFKQHRIKKGSLEPMIIHTLASSPMTGYDIIQNIEKASHGIWKPSPGSIYPTLQLLTEKGLATVQEDGNKKVYSLTEAGRATIDQKGQEIYKNISNKQHYTELRNLVHEIAMTTKLIAISSDSHTTQEIKAVLQDALEALRAIKDSTKDNDKKDKNEVR